MAGASMLPFFRPELISGIQSGSYKMEQEHAPLLTRGIPECEQEYINNIM
jgi:hypothetical protein